MHFKILASGQKRCQVCELFIKWDGLFCPCCGYKLRTRPRNFNLKTKLREQEGVEEGNQTSISINKRYIPSKV
jgi:predicted amidophosphoribosyltransferase